MGSILLMGEDEDCHKDYMELLNQIFLVEGVKQRNALFVADVGMDPVPLVRQINYELSVLCVILSLIICEFQSIAIKLAQVAHEGGNRSFDYL